MDTQIEKKALPKPTIGLGMASLIKYRADRGVIIRNPEPDRQLAFTVLLLAMSEFRPTLYHFEESEQRFAEVCRGFGVDLVEIADGMLAKPKAKKKAA
jgi:hypothetical protein